MAYYSFNIDASSNEISLLKVQICLQVQTRVLAFWPTQIPKADRNATAKKREVKNGIRGNCLETEYDMIRVPSKFMKNVVGLFAALQRKNNKVLL